MSELEQWVGRTQQSHDVITLGGVKRFCATTGVDFNSSDTTTAPLGYHWCLCLPDNPMSELGVDGHPLKGDFLPPIELPRRMWAASNVEFFGVLPIGAEVTRFSTIASVKEKSGKTGALVFVDVEHETHINNHCVIKETQTIVYREATTAPMPLPDIVAEKVAEQKKDWPISKEILPTTAMLFRYSALTFNSHRIHYDRVYAIEQESYPELVVHGPLMATLVLQLAGAHHNLKTFSYRSVSPAFCNQVLTMAAKFNNHDGELTMIGADGRTCLTATVEF